MIVIKSCKIIYQILSLYDIYDTKEEKFLNHIRPFHAFEDEWRCWKTINDHTELRNLNYEKKEV